MSWIPLPPKPTNQRTSHTSVRSVSCDFLFLWKHTMLHSGFCFYSWYKKNKIKRAEHEGKTGEDGLAHIAGCEQVRIISWTCRRRLASPGVHSQVRTPAPCCVLPPFSDYRCSHLNIYSFQNSQVCQIHSAVRRARQGFSFLLPAPNIFTIINNEMWYLQVFLFFFFFT